MVEQNLHRSIQIVIFDETETFLKLLARILCPFDLRFLLDTVLRMTDRIAEVVAHFLRSLFPSLSMILASHPRNGLLVG